MTGNLRIFLSSTCNDLSIERESVKAKIRDLGHDCIRNEEEFPVGDEQNSIAACRFNVRENTDIVLLIIGSRLGWVDPATGKSVVRIEFETAIDNLIDVIVFIKRDVWNSYNEWKTNPGGDYSGVVDSTEVFELISDATDNGNNFILTFDSSEELIGIVSQRLSSLFRSLILRKKEGTLKPNAAFILESVEIQNLVQLRPRLWYVKLMELLLRSRLKELVENLDKISSGAYYEPSRFFKTSEFIPWFWTKFIDLGNLMLSVILLINSELSILVGSGKPEPNPIDMRIIADKLQKVVSDLFNWQKDFHFTLASSECQPAIEMGKNLTSKLIQSIASIADDFQRIFESEGKEGQYKIEIDIGIGENLMDGMTAFFDLVKSDPVGNDLKDLSQILSNSKYKILEKFGTTE